MTEEETVAHMRKMLSFARAYGMGEKRLKEVSSDASKKQSAKPVPKSEIRPFVGPQTPLRRHD